MSASLPAYVRVLPRRAVSRALGVLGRLPLPAPLLVPVLWIYARAFGADLSESDRPLRSFSSFLDFFTRRLKPGARRAPEDPAVVVSPADGRVHASGDVSDGTLLQAKGLTYGVAELLAADDTARRFEGGSFLTVYLAPGDYHRFHWPFDAVVEAVRYVPGDLWPVHPGAVASVPRLFARNERVVMEGRRGGGRFAIVPVGALNVGSIRLAFHDLRTNRGGGRGRTWRLDDVRVSRGEEMGHFEFGSALVMLLSREAGRFDALAPGTPLRVGQPIGR